MAVVIKYKPQLICYIVMIALSQKCFTQKKTDSAYISILAGENIINKNKIDSLGASLNDIKNHLKLSSQSGVANYINASLFFDAAIGTINNLKSLIHKENYRNKMAALNNPAGNELGFNLETQLQLALKPILDKCKLADRNRFKGIVGSLLNAGNKTLNGFFSGSNIFSSVVGIVGNITITEKKVTKEDFDTFLQTISKYFNQYEKLYNAGNILKAEIEKYKIQLKYNEEDIKNTMIDIILIIRKAESRDKLQKINSEDLMLQYLDFRNIDPRVNAMLNQPFPPDVIKSCKEITIALQRLHEEYSITFNNNYKTIKDIISQTKSVSENINVAQINKTLSEIESLYLESKDSDNSSLRLKTLQARLERFIIN